MVVSWNLAVAQDCLGSGQNCTQPTPYRGEKVTALYRAFNPQGVRSPTILMPQLSFTSSSTGTITWNTVDSYFAYCTACFAEPCSDIISGGNLRPCSPALFASLRGQVVSPTSWYDYVYAGRCYVSGGMTGGIVITRYSHGSLLFDTLLRVLQLKAEAGLVQYHTRTRYISGRLRNYYLFGKNVPAATWTALQNAVASASAGTYLTDAMLPEQVEDILIIAGNPLDRTDLTAPDCTLCEMYSALDDIRDMLRDFTSAQFKSEVEPDGLRYSDWMRQRTPKLWSWSRMLTEVVAAIMPTYRSCASVGGNLLVLYTVPVIQDMPIDEVAVQNDIPNNARVMAQVYGRLLDPNWGHLIPVLYTRAPPFMGVDGMMITGFLNTCSPIMYYGFNLTRIVSWVFITIWFARSVFRILWRVVD